MPVRIGTNWRSSLFIVGDDGKPFEFKNVVCDLEEPDEVPEVMAGKTVEKEE